MSDEKTIPPHGETKYNSAAPERSYSARAVDEQRRYEDRGMQLAQGTELLMKHADGHSLTQAEQDVLFANHQQHTKELFENLQRLNVKRQRALGRGRGRHQQRSTTTTRKVAKSRKGVPKVHVHTHAPGRSTQKSSRTTPKGSARSRLPTTPRSSASGNDAKTIRFRGAASSTSSSSHPHPHSHRHPTVDDQQQQRRQQQQHSSRRRGGGGSNHQHQTESKSSNNGDAVSLTTKRRNVAPLRPASHQGPQQSTEAAHGAQYTRHAHMLQDQQMSTDPYPHTCLLYTSPSPRDRG